MSDVAECEVPEQGRIVLAPFPWVEKDKLTGTMTPKYKVRPSLVISNEWYHKTYRHCRVAQITHIGPRAESMDIVISGWRALRLHSFSVLRPDRVFTFQFQEIQIVPELGNSGREVLAKALALNRRIVEMDE